MSTENQSENFNQQDPSNEEDLSTLLKVASVLIPLVGIILFFVEKNKNPKKSKSACYFAIGGFLLNLILNIIFRIYINK